MTLQSLYKIFPTVNGFPYSRRTSSVYGISKENTANRYTPILPLDARNHPSHRPRKTFETGRSQSRIAWDQIYIRAL